MVPPGNDSSDTLGEPFPSGTEEDLRQEPLGGFDLGSLREQATGNTTAHPPLTHEERAGLSPQVLTIQRNNTSANARELRGNMEAQGEVFGPGEYAHHIVSSTDGRYRAAVENRETLEDFGIDINDAANGVRLTREQHYGRALHSRRGAEAVRERLEEADSREEAKDVLNEIAQEILSGSFPP